MPAELPTIASCPHCGTILIRTPRVLVHPMSGEREQIRRTLGGFWPEHAHTRFDGRIHHCPGRRRPAGGKALASAIHQGRITWLLLMTISMSLMATPHSVAQEDSVTWLLGRGATARHRESFRGGGPRSSPGSLSPFGVEELFAPPRRPIEPGSLGRHPAVEVAAGSHIPGDDPGEDDTGQSWRGLELASGRYQVVDTIREDVAGVVYLAHDRNLDSHVDVEVPTISADQKAGATVQFVRAVRSLARLGHPHLARVTEVGTYREAPFVVAEHLAGGSLKFRRPLGADGGPLPVAPESLEEWLPDIASALDYLHSQGRVYLELSPASILFDAQGRAYLGGLAMSEAVAVRMDTAPASRPLPLSQGRGPALALAPELVDGAKPDGRADQYALAATVYELLSGHPPFPDQTPAGVASRQSTDEVPDLLEKNPAISRALSSSVLRGLRRDPKERYPDCSAFASAVLAAAHEAAPLPGVAIVDRPGAIPNAAPRSSNTSTRRVPDRPSSVTSQVVAVGLVCSMVVAAVGVKARRRPNRERMAPSSTMPRQVAGKRLRWPRAISSQPRQTGQAETSATGRVRSSRDDAHGPTPAIGGTLLHRHELEAGPRTHVAHSLLPVPYLRAGESLPERRGRAAGTEPDRVASRRAS